MKKYFLILAIVCAAIAAWVVAFPAKNPFNKLTAKTTPGDAQTTTPTPTPSSSSGKSLFNPSAPPEKDKFGFPLSIGSRNNYVSALQSGLNDNYGNDLDIDGIFGQKTYNAVSAHGFNADAVSRTEYLKIING